MKWFGNFSFTYMLQVIVFAMINNKVEEGHWLEETASQRGFFRADPFYHVRLQTKLFGIDLNYQAAFRIFDMVQDYPLCFKQHTAKILGKDQSMMRILVTIVSEPSSVAANTR